MRNEKNSHAHLFLQLGNEREDLRLDRHVERRRRLVGNQKTRLAGQRHSDHHALTHAARQLMGIAKRNFFGIGNADQLQKTDRIRNSLGTVEIAVQAQTFSNLFANREYRIERRHRFLKDHCDFVAADLSQRRFVRRQIDGRAVAAGEPNAAADDLSAAVFDETHDSQRRDGLAGTRFANKSERFTLPDAERLVNYSIHKTVLGFEADGEMLNFQDSALLVSDLRLGGSVFFLFFCHCFCLCEGRARYRHRAPAVIQVKSVSDYAACS